MRFIPLLLLAVLVGCATTYVHPDKDEHDYKRDRNECRSLCYSEHPVDIEVQYSRVHLDNSAEFQEVDINQGPRTRCIIRCLNEKGWREE